MTKNKTLNEKEQREAVYKELQARGIKVTKVLVDQMMDTANDLTFNALKNGIGIKLSGVGTIAVVPHKQRAWEINGKSGISPAGVHVKFIESDKLFKAMNAEATISASAS